MTRFLGIDYGGKRIGLSVSDPAATLASPLATIVAGSDAGADIRALLARTDGYDIDEFVVGLPLNMDDSEGDQARVAKRFGDELARVTGKPVHLWDERLSTHAAAELLRPAGLTRKKRKKSLDSVAAAVLLQAFLDARGP